MKNLGLTILFLVVSFSNSFSQNVAVELERNNILYIDLENPVRIAVENNSCKNLVVKIDNGTITGGNGFYTCHPKFMRPANISVYINQLGKLKRIKTITFRIKYYVPIENIQFSVGRCGNNCKITTTELRQQHYVSAPVVNMDFDYKYPVDSFKVEVRYKDSIKTFKNIGNELNQEILAEFALVKADSEILFTDIYTHRPVTETIFTLSPIKLIVTE